MDVSKAPSKASLSKGSILLPSSLSKGSILLLASLSKGSILLRLRVLCRGLTASNRLARHILRIVMRL